MLGKGGGHEQNIYPCLFGWMVDEHDGVSLVAELHQVGPPVTRVQQQIRSPVLRLNEPTELYHYEGEGYHLGRLINLVACAQT